ncbi:MAG: hypothetical protein ACO1N7_07790, partial [Sphingobacteriaceae bacterium]
MKKIIYYSLICLLVKFASCTNSGQGEDDSKSFKKGDGGLYYKIVEDVDSPEVGEVAFVSLSYKEATENGTLISET